MEDPLDKWLELTRLQALLVPALQTSYASWSKCSRVVLRMDRSLPNESDELQEDAVHICTAHGNPLKIEAKASIEGQLSSGGCVQKKRESVDMHGPRS